MKYIINNKIKIRKEEETSLIFDPVEDNFIELNSSAMEILELCKQGKDNDEIVNLLSKEYEVNKEKMKNDVDEVIALLIDIKVLMRE